MSRDRSRPARTKRDGDTTAVSDPTISVQPGIVTLAGRPLAEHHHPLTDLGAMFEVRAIHPNWSAYS